MKYRIEVGQRGADGLWVWKVKPEGAYTVLASGLGMTRVTARFGAKKAARKHARSGRDALPRSDTSERFTYEPLVQSRSTTPAAFLLGLGLLAVVWGVLLLVGVL